MTKNRLYCLVFLLLVTLPVIPVAVAQQNEKKGACETISAGFSPDRRFSIAQKHQDTDSRHREVYLMAEPGHREIGPLEEVEANGKWPPRYHAYWSSDSGHVAVNYTLGSSVINTALYRIKNRRAYPIALPDLMKITGKSHHSSLSGYVFNDWKAHGTQIKWLSRQRFRLLQADTLKGIPRQRTTNMGRFYQIIDGYEAGDDTVVIGFSAEAVCQLLPDGRCSVVSIKPGEPMQ